MYWIRSAVKRSQTYQSRVITVPQRLHANHKKVKLSQRQLQQAMGRPPTQQELAEASGMSLIQLQRCFKAMDQRCYSLDQTITNRNRPSIDTSRDGSLLDILETKTDDGDGVSKISRVFLREDLVESLYRSLDRESAHIIMLRYGLVDSHILPRGYEGPLTIAQVSQLVAMKPDKVRRRIIKSLKELKFSIGNEWKDFERAVE
jgi:DNA-directed RNA polymerase sigma subunit (sigma70/sigma32)